MADEYYGVNANEYGWFRESGDDYNRTVQRSTRVLSKFNKEQKATAWQNIKTTAIVVAGVNLIERTFNRALGSLQRSIRKFTFEPMMDGLSEYTDQLTSFQAIIQNSSQFFDEIGGVEQVEAITAALDELNDYADLTIYRFRDMQSSFTGFVNAGLTLTDASTMSRGIASLTAYMGKGVNEYASAAYMFNQAMQQGKMQYYQWRSIEQFAGIGGEQTKKLFIQTAKALGKDAPDWEDLYNIYDSLGGEEGDQAFRDTLADDWLTGDVILEAMKVLNQEYDEATLKAKGYSKEIINMANTALSESQKVRTFSQFNDAVIESIGTGWGQAFRAFFGDTTVATAFWTDLMNTVTDDIGKVMDKIQTYSNTFVEEGGRQAFQDTLFNIWKIIKNIGKAISKLFSKDPGKKLANIAKALRTITDILVGSSSIPELDAPEWFSTLFGFVLRLKEVISSVFSRLKNIGVKIYQQAIKPILESVMVLLMTIGPEILNFIDNVITWIEKATDSILNSGIVQAISAFFTGTADALSAGNKNGILGFITTFLSDMKNAIEGVNLDGVIGSFVEFLNSFSGLVGSDGVSGILEFFATSAKMLIGLKSSKKVFKLIAEIADEFSGIDVSFLKIVSAILGVTLGLYIIASINNDVLWTAAYKSVIFGLSLRMVSKALSKVTDSVYNLWKIVPLILFIGTLVAGLAYGGYLIRKYTGDLSIIEDTLKIVQSFLSSLTDMIWAFAGVAAIFTIKSAIALMKVKQTANTVTDWGAVIKDIFKKGKLTINFKIGDNFTTRLSAITAFLGGMYFYIKSALEFIWDMAYLPEDKMWRGILALASVFGMLEILILTISIGYRNTSKQTEKVKKKSSIGNLLALSIFLLSLAGIINAMRKAVLEFSEMDEEAIGKGLFGLLVVLSLIDGFIIAMAHVEFDLKSLFGLLMLGTIIAYTFEVIALCRWIGTWDYDAIERGAKIMGTIAASLVVLVSYLSLVSLLFKSMSLGTMARYSILIASISFFIISTSVLTGMALLIGNLPIDKIEQGLDVMTRILTLLVITFGIIAIIGAVVGNQAPLLGTMAGFGILIGGVVMLALTLSLLSFIPTEKLRTAMIAIVTISGIAIGLLAAVSIFAKADINIKTILGVLMFVSIVFVLTILTEALVGLASVSGDKLGSVLGVLSGILAVIGTMAIILGVISETGIGAAAIWTGIAALAAIAAIFYVFASGTRVFAKAMSDLGTGVYDLVDAFKSIGNIDFKKFNSNLDKFLDAIEDALPRIEELSTAIGGVAGTLIIAGGSVSIGAGTVSVPNATVSGSSTNIISDSQQNLISEETKAHKSANENKAYSIMKGGTSGLIEGLLTSIIKFTPIGMLADSTITTIDLIERIKEVGFKEAFKDFPNQTKSYLSNFALGSSSSSSSDIDIGSSITDAISDKIDVSEQYSKYSVLDDIALGNNSKSDVIDALEDIKEAQRQTNASPEAVAEAVEKILGKMEIKLDASKLGMVVDQVLGRVSTD